MGVLSCCALACWASPCERLHPRSVAGVYPEGSAHGPQPNSPGARSTLAAPSPSPPMEAAVTPPGVLERRLAEQRALVAGLQAGRALDAQIQGHLATKANVARAQADLEAQRLQRGAVQVRRRRSAAAVPACRSSCSRLSAPPLASHGAPLPTIPCTPQPPPQREHALSLAATQVGLDLAKNRVDLHRWRQRTALLKVRLSSAHEDVDRYRRMGELLRRQYELEVVAKAGEQGRGNTLAAQVAALVQHMGQQAATIAGLQADLLRAQEAMAARDAELAAQQAAAVAAGDAAQAELAEAQAAARSLQEQLAAVQERARLAEQTAAAAQV